MLPAVRPASLLAAAGAGIVVLNALSIWLRLTAAEVHRRPGAFDEPFPGFNRLFRLFQADGEANVSAWFSVMLLAATGACCAGIAARLRREGRGAGRRWGVLAGIFLFLSVDELAMLHEQTIPFMAEVVEAEGALSFPWIVIAIPLVVVVTLLYAPFVWALPRHIGGLFVLAGMLYVGGAIGLEALGGQFYDGGRGVWSQAYVWVTTIEELLEMVGAAVALYAVTRFADEMLPVRPLSPDPAAAEA